VVDYEFADPGSVLHDDWPSYGTSARWMERGYGGFWLLTPVRGRAGRGRTTSATPPPGHHDPAHRGVHAGHPAELDPPEHTPYRKLALPYFTAPAIARLEPEIRQIVRRCIRAFARTAHRPGAVDRRGGPAAGHRRRDGLDPADCREIRELAGNFLSSAKVGIEAKIRAAKELEAWLKQRITARREQPTGDTLSALVNARIDGAPITPLTALGMVQLMVVAGHETTVHGIGSMLFRVAAEPGLRERLLADPSRCGPPCTSRCGSTRRSCTMARTASATTSAPAPGCATATR